MFWVWVYDKPDLQISGFQVLQKQGSPLAPNSGGTREEEVGEEGRSNHYNKGILISTEFGAFYG